MSPGIILERDPSVRTWFNNKPTVLIDFINQTGWRQKDWTTFSFAGRKLYHPSTKKKLNDEEIIKLIMRYYQTLTRRVTKSPVYPILFVSYYPKSLHFHSIELSEGITRKQRAQAFRRTFGRFCSLPKDLYKSVIHSEPFNPDKGAVFYSSGGHNQLETTVFKPRIKAKINKSLMGTLNPKIRGHQRMNDDWFIVEKDHQEPVTFPDFESRLLHILNQ